MAAVATSSSTGGSGAAAQLPSQQVNLDADEVVWVLSLDEAAKLWLTRIEDAGKLTSEKAQNLWRQWKSLPATAAARYSTGQDIMTLQKIVSDFGTMFGRVVVKEYNGVEHIILKGYPGLRKVLTGTKYGVNNPKVVSMGIGKSGAMKSIREGGILTVVLVSAYDIVDYVLTDKATLSDLVGQLASDITKVAITAGISAASVALVAGTIVSSFALGPLLVAVVVGVGVGFVLDAIDDHFKLTSKLKSMLAAVAQKMRDLGEQAERKVKQAEQSFIDWALDGVRALAGQIIDAAEDYAAAYLWRKINDLRWYFVPRF